MTAQAYPTARLDTAPTHAVVLCLLRHSKRPGWTLYLHMLLFCVCSGLSNSQAGHWAYTCCCSVSAQAYANRQAGHLHTHAVVLCLLRHSQQPGWTLCLHMLLFCVCSGIANSQAGHCTYSCCSASAQA